jgi:hypothetical protein
LIEGIVQQVFKKGRQARLSNEQLEQLLLVEIEKESFELEKTTGGDIKLIEIEKLIGDNKE